MDIPKNISSLSPYQGGKPIEELAREMGLAVTDIIKLASNENPLGVPESAQRAMTALLSECARYPDGNGYELKKVIAQKFEVEMAQITLGNGSNDILELIGCCLLQDGDAVMFSQYSFVVYALVAQVNNAITQIVPAKNYGNDLAAMLAAMTPRTRIVYLANPNNPTGTFISGDDLYQFLLAVPPHVMVVLDEAYTEYLDEGVRYDAIAWLKTFPNLLITRTFSKAYGLAGLRVGFGLSSLEIANCLNSVRQPFNVSLLAQSAAAAALGDDNFLQQSREVNRAGYTQLVEMCDHLQLDYIPSFGNFLMIRVAGGSTAREDAQTIYQFLLSRGVIVRPVASYDLPAWIRVSIGLPAENQKFMAAMVAALGEGGVHREIWQRGF